MKQWMADRHNKGQDKNKIVKVFDGGVHIIEKDDPHVVTYLSNYDILFDLHWGFAKAFGKSIYGNTQCYLLDCHWREKDHSYEAIQFDIQDSLLEQMATSKNVMKYLEQFK
jgi:hypothetical protein